MPDLMRNFENYRDDIRALTRYRKRIGNYQLLILDEWLNYKVSERDAKILYELFEQRCGTNLRKIYDTKRLKKLVDTIEK